MRTISTKTTNAVLLLLAVLALMLLLFANGCAKEPELRYSFRLENAAGDTVTVLFTTRNGAEQWARDNLSEPHVIHKVDSKEAGR